MSSDKNGGDLTAKEIIIACRNIGVDLNCPACVCEDLKIEVGDRIAIRGGSVVVVTAIGMSSILVRPSRGPEKVILEPSQIFARYELNTISLEFTPTL